MILRSRALVGIYKSFIISHFACKHISDQVNNNSFHNNLSIERNVLSKITGAKWSTSKEYIYQELDLKSLQHECWFRKLHTFYKIYKNQSRVISRSYCPFKPARTSQDHLKIHPVSFLKEML